MKRLLVMLALTMMGSTLHASPLLLISIDGLRPGDVLAADQRGLKVPNLRRFVAQGAYADNVRGVLPTVTYPSHTTLLTGVSPARHGVVSNLTFDPLRKNAQGWYWYAEDIRVPTLWDVAHAAHLSTANVHWPVSVGAAVDYNLPQIWRTGTDDDRKLQRAVSTPGLLAALEHDLGPYADGEDDSIDADETRGRFAERIVETDHPHFMTAYFTALDDAQHAFGPDTPQAHAVLERIDAIVGRLVAAERKSEPKSVVAIVSDHGFAGLAHDVNLTAAFVKAGLITLGADGKVSAWKSTAWYSGGSAAIVLHDPNDATARDTTSRLLRKLAADDSNGIARVLDRTEIAKENGNPQAEWYVLFRPGFEMAPELTQPALSPSKLRGMHGYAPELPEMQSVFFAEGTGVPAGKSLGNIDMRAIAPTLARALGVTLTQAECPAVF